VRTVSAFSVITRRLSPGLPGLGCSVTVIVCWPSEFVLDGRNPLKYSCGLYPLPVRLKVALGDRHPCVAFAIVPAARPTSRASAFSKDSFLAPFFIGQYPELAYRSDSHFCHLAQLFAELASRGSKPPVDLEFRARSACVHQTPPKRMKVTPRRIRTESTRLHLGIGVLAVVPRVEVDEEQTDEANRDIHEENEPPVEVGDD
jgi:hypothetical protein